MAKLAIKGVWYEYAEIMYTLGTLSDAREYVVKPLSNDTMVVCMVEGDFEGLSHYKIFTFDDYKKMYHRQIGDSVLISEGYGTINSMSWDDEAEDMRYTLTLFDSEETRECYNKDFIDYSIYEGAIGKPDGYIFVNDEGKPIDTDTVKIVKKRPSYPKTYEEACKILGFKEPYKHKINAHNPKYGDILLAFYTLLLCRDAFWLVAGQELELEGNWKPDIVNGVYTASIINRSGNVVKDSGFDSENKLLMFHSDEVRNKFLEYFGHLITVCKDLI